MTVDIYLRAFPVRLLDQRTGKSRDGVFVLDKARLQAAQLIGQSSKEIIHRYYNRRGFRVLDVGKADKLTASVDLDSLYQWEKAARADASGA